MIAALKKNVRRATLVARVLYALGSCIAILLLNVRCLLKAQIIVVMRTWGFGETLTGPDVTRRLFPGHRCLCLAPSDPRHNPRVSAIWPDINVIFLPMNPIFNILWDSKNGGPTREKFRRLMKKVARIGVRITAGHHAQLLNLKGLY